MEGETARVDWATVAEINNDYFVVERSKDGNYWESIGQVKGAGNSNVLIDYTYYDNNPYSGISYYRLTQVDFDGTSSTTHMVAVDNKLTDDAEITYYPNPTDGKFYFFAHEDLEIEIRTIDGRVVKQVKIYANTKTEIDLSENQSGLYLLYIRTSNNKSIRKLVVK
jgi:hypothetical protein